MPTQVRQALRKLGQDINKARRRRRLTVAMMLDRLNISKRTYQKLERGDPTVAMGTYAMAFFVLGFGTPLADILDVRRDEQGLALEAEQLPKRIRPRTEPRAS